MKSQIHASKPQVHTSKMLVAMGLAVLFAAGCATTQSIPVSDRTHTFEADYDAVFAATARVLVAEGYVLKTIDKDVGLIDTDYKHRSGFTLKGKQRRKVNALMIVVGTATRLTLTMAVEEPNDEGDWQSVPFTTDAALKYYDELLEKIEYELHGRVGTN